MQHLEYSSEGGGESVQKLTQEAAQEVILASVEKPEDAGENFILSSALPEVSVGELRISGVGGEILDWVIGLFSGEHGENKGDDTDVAGQVQKLLGTASVTREGEEKALLLGDDVFANDTISTGANSALGIVFIDGMEFNLGSDAKLLIDEFVFDQADSTGEQSLSAIKGAFSYQSGALAQADPSAVTIKTALGTLGIRGTKLMGLSDYPEGTCVITLLDGTIEVTRDKGGSTILDKPFDTARMKVEWEYIDKSQLSREEAIDAFSSLFGGDKGALQEFIAGDKSSSIDEPLPYSLYDASAEDSSLFLQAEG